MKPIVAVFLFIATLFTVGAIPAEDQKLVYEDQLNKATITLTDQPCTNVDVLESLVDEFHKHFHSGTITYDLGFIKIDLNLCWAFNKALDPKVDEGKDDPLIAIMDEGGDHGFMHYRMFLPKDYI